MEHDTALAVAQAFVEARATGQRLQGRLLARQLSSLGQAYAVQRHTADLIGDRIAGWKVGCANLAQQKYFSVREPFYGPVFAGDVLRSPATEDPGRFHMLGIECEIMFRLKSDIKPDEKRSGDWTDVIDAVIPGFEIFSSRIDAPLNHGILPLIADCGGNGALILGSPSMQWQDLDLANSSVTLSVDGKAVAEGTGGVVLGNPCHSFEWFIETCREGGQKLEAGQVIACGSMTPVFWAEAGQSLVADFGGLGRVSLSLDK